MYNESVAECSKCGSRLDDKNSMWCEDCYGELREEIDRQSEVIESLEGKVYDLESELKESQIVMERGGQ